MRTGKVTVNGKEYLLCFSTRVIMALQKQGDIESVLNKIVEENDIQGLFNVLSLMIDAGARYAKLEGIQNPEPISFDDLVDSVGLDDYNELLTSISDAIDSGTQTTVEVANEKKINASL